MEMERDLVVKSWIQVLALSNLSSPVVHREDNLYLIAQEESGQLSVM